MNQDKKKDRPINALIAIITTLIIERVVSPYLEKSLGWISTKEFWITNLLYKRMAEGFLVNIAFYIFLLLALFISYSILNSASGNEDVKIECGDACKDKNCDFCLRKIMVIMKNIAIMYIERIPKKIVVVIFWGVVIVFLTATNFVNHSMVKTQNNIEILAECIDDKQYKHLKSLFYQMDGYDDYYLLTEEIKKIANKNDVTLQE